MFSKIFLILFLFCFSIQTSEIDMNAHQNQVELKEYKKQVMCLAKNIFYESGSESLKGKIAVAYVTHNRLKDKNFPRNYCDIVYQTNQFSWTNNKLYQKRHVISDKDWRWKESVFVAENFLFYKDPTNGSLFFHEKSIVPKWSMDIEKTNTVGNHVFYKLVKNN